MLKSMGKRYSLYSRRKRAKLFQQYLQPKETDRIIDLGCGDGSHIAQIVPFRENVYIADIIPEKLEIAKTKYGFKNTILLSEEGRLSVPDKFFEICFSSSVIEHVTDSKQEILKITGSNEFSE